MPNEIESLYAGIVLTGIGGLVSLWLIYQIVKYALEEVFG